MRWTALRPPGEVTAHQVRASSRSLNLSHPSVVEVVQVAAVHPSGRATTLKARLCYATRRPGVDRTIWNTTTPAPHWPDEAMTPRPTIRCRTRLRAVKAGRVELRAQVLPLSGRATSLRVATNPRTQTLEVPLRLPGGPTIVLLSLRRVAESPEVMMDAVPRHPGEATSFQEPPRYGRRSPSALSTALVPPPPEPPTPTRQATPS